MLYCNIFQTPTGAFFADVPLKTFPVPDQFFNLGEALMMAKIAAAYVRLGLSFDQVGFIMSPFLNSQRLLLFCLFRHIFHFTDKELNKLAIGKESNFQVHKWRPREVIIRSTPCPAEKKFLKDGNDLQISRSVAKSIIVVS